LALFLDFCLPPELFPGAFFSPLFAGNSSGVRCSLPPFTGSAVADSSIHPLFSYRPCLAFFLDFIDPFSPFSIYLRYRSMQGGRPSPSVLAEAVKVFTPLSNDHPDSFELSGSPPGFPFNINCRLTFFPFRSCTLCSTVDPLIVYFALDLVKVCLFLIFCVSGSTSSFCQFRASDFLSSETPGFALATPRPDQAVPPPRIYLGSFLLPSPVFSLRDETWSPLLLSLNGRLRLYPPFSRNYLRRFFFPRLVQIFLTQCPGTFSSISPVSGVDVLFIPLLMHSVPNGVRISWIFLRVLQYAISFLVLLFSQDPAFLLRILVNEEVPPGLFRPSTTPSFSHLGKRCRFFTFPFGILHYPFPFPCPRACRRSSSRSVSGR